MKSMNPSRWRFSVIQLVFKLKGSVRDAFEMNSFESKRVQLGRLVLDGNWPLTPKATFSFLF